MTTHNEIAFETALRRAYVFQVDLNDSTIERMAKTFNLSPDVVSAIAAKVAQWHADRQSAMR